MCKTINEQIFDMLVMTDRIDKKVLQVERYTKERYIKSDSVWNLRKNVKYINKLINLYNIEDKKKFTSMIISIGLGTPYINISKSIWKTIEICKENGYNDRLKNLKNTLENFNRGDTYNLLFYNDNLANSLVQCLENIWGFIIKHEWKIDMNKYYRTHKRRYLGINIDKRELYILGLFDIFKVKDGELEYVQEVCATTSRIEYDWYETQLMGEGKFDINDMDVFIKNIDKDTLKFY